MLVGHGLNDDNGGVVGWEEHLQGKLRECHIGGVPKIVVVFRNDTVPKRVAIRSGVA